MRASRAKDPARSSSPCWRASAPCSRRRRRAGRSRWSHRKERTAMERKHEKYERLLDRAKAHAPVPTAVAHPCDESSLAGAVDAAKLGLIKPILVGPKARIVAVAEKSRISLSGFEVIDAEHSHASAAKAVAIVKEGRAECLMKGSLHTDELMGAVVSREGGLRTARRISHAFVM